MLEWFYEKAAARGICEAAAKKKLWRCPCMDGLVDTGLGKIMIDTDVIATYAGSVAVECFGIVGMAAVKYERRAC